MMPIHRLYLQLHIYAADVKTDLQHALLPNIYFFYFSKAA